ncbi:hypothetical protein F2P81_011447 [Scophthalmus maximus]|uniref:protein-tyrosine-phosphatase n=1 Tax=Scophthalmus maximus TaxID=52904 RepID=A0A6A4STY3_SCOMX|nr:hypothetical protein F2P81_011447 [Scophthalmus maximus]
MRVLRSSVIHGSFLFAASTWHLFQSIDADTTLFYFLLNFSLKYQDNRKRHEELNEVGKDLPTRGPLHNTMADFWRMVWEQNVSVIVMVTALRHKDMVLCDKYWPLERGTVYQGLIQVTTVTVKQGPDYFITTINLRQRDCPTDRTITHYYYHSWPDRGVPKESTSLWAFTEHVRHHLEAIPRLGPCVVHCSAGVGRSGTFVTLLWLMQLCARGIQPDIRAAVEDLRLHRMWMVQNLPTDSGSRCKNDPPLSGSASQLLRTGRANGPEQTTPSQTETSSGPAAEHDTADSTPWEPSEETAALIVSVESRLKHLLSSHTR